ncbi:cytochrome P450 [Amycolatopsis pithecellobii]|uniref:Cytochrome P450 n=1 Tax=Amycolatopsis pithecellobii TaxID=664692 RepID=A0A6N7YZ13_9PSEU|nr:cytochrome P450 [Amycolatopsis pithecellobii]MTD52390.1 cytochrome P450 [Amycolatopsis pithecellobii]
MPVDSRDTPGLRQEPAQQYDLLSPDILADPYPIYDLLRATDPVHFDERLDSWLLLRYDDVLDALSSPERFSSDRTAAYLGHLQGADAERFRQFADIRSRMLIYNDPPRHTRLRRPVRRGMSVRLVNGLRPRIREVVHELIDAVIEDGRADGIDDLGARIPVVVNSDLIGIPAADREKVKGWTADFVAAINAGGANVPTADLERGQNAVLAMREYFLDLGAARRAEPREDMLTALVRRDEDALGDDDLVATCIVTLFAGLETGLNLIGNGLLALLRHPEQVALLAERPDLVPGAVEEFLRYDGPLHLVGRLATEDITLRRQTIKKGDKVLVMLGAANHDPEVFPAPHELDIRRGENKHVAFSHGIHYCPGAELSRIEGEIAFEAILGRLSGLRQADGPLEWQPNLSFRGLRHLPLEFTPAPRKGPR